VIGASLETAAVKIISAAKVYDASSDEKEIPAASATLRVIGWSRPQRIIKHNNVRRIGINL
jgi:hypothetical protein